MNRQPQPVIAFGYDANGNTTTKSEGSNFWRYTWDYENRMAEAATRKQKVRYKFDALGRRVQRIVGSGKENTKFIHDGHDVLVDDDGGTLTKYLNGEGIDEKLRVQQGSTVNYFLADHLGSTNGLADPSGALTAATSYDSFGNSTSTNFPSRYQYSGREYDSASGLHYYRARWYDSKLGRFVSEDPIGLPGGINLYSYVGNRPLMLTDPFGLDENWDQQVWQAQQDLINAAAPAIEFGMGFGDTTLFGASRTLRQWQGIDDQNLDCSTAYSAGGWTAVAVQVAMGGAAGLRAAGGKAAGFEFSHWIPKRFGGPRSIFNGNFVRTAEHALTDPYRYRFMPRVWKASNPMFHPLTQQWYRIPRAFKGLGLGIAAGATSGYATSSQCECR